MYTKKKGCKRRYEEEESGKRKECQEGGRDDTREACFRSRYRVGVGAKVRSVVIN